MLKQRKAFIWDLDGTLLDSYGIIVSSLRKTYQEYGLPIDEEDVHRHVIRYSVNSFIRHMEEKNRRSVCGYERPLFRDHR